MQITHKAIGVKNHVGTVMVLEGADLQSRTNAAAAAAAIEHLQQRFQMS